MKQANCKPTHRQQPIHSFLTHQPTTLYNHVLVWRPLSSQCLLIYTSIELSPNTTLNVWVKFIRSKETNINIRCTFTTACHVHPFVGIPSLFSFANFSLNTTKAMSISLKTFQNNNTTTDATGNRSNSQRFVWPHTHCILLRMICMFTFLSTQCYLIARR